MFSFRKLFGSAVFTAMVACVASQANAGLTQVRTTPHASEQGIAQILGQRYGGSFGSSGSGFTNGAISATRVDDNIDSLWTGGQVTFTPVASFSRSEQTLGLSLANGQGGQNLFSVNQFGYLNESPATVNLGSNTWQLTLDNSATQLRTASKPGTTGDQLVTYRINGLNGGNTYLMFWEDTPINLGDADYNDLVVEAAFKGNGGPNAVPLPPAVLIGGATLGGAALWSAWKRRKMRLA